MTTLVLVRHGQTEWNRVERFRGQADIALNETGRAQAEAAAQAIQERWRPASVYLSPLERAMDTAKAIGRRFDLTPRPEPALTDIDYGSWQGLAVEDVRKRWPEILDAWYREPATVRIPGGESLDGVRVRCDSGLRSLTARHPGEIVIVVGHTVVNRVMLLIALGLGNDCFWHLRQDTCAINQIDWDGRCFVLASMNDTCHLRVSVAMPTRPL